MEAVKSYENNTLLPQTQRNDDDLRAYSAQTIIFTKVIIYRMSETNTITAPSSCSSCSFRNDSSTHYPHHLQHPPLPQTLPPPAGRSPPLTVRKP